MELSDKSIPKKGTELELDIQALAFGARGIARINDMVCFVDDTLPGQKVLARIARRKKNYCEARLLQVIKQSEQYVAPVCRHVNGCGGCSLQHFIYSGQLAAKEEQVRDILQRLGGLKEFTLLPILAAEEQFYYRNKMEFSFAPERWLDVDEINSNAEVNKNGHYLGMHAKGFFEKVVDLQECHLADPIVADIVKSVRAMAAKSGWPAYGSRAQKGFWRFLVIRKCKNTADLMVNVVTRNYHDNAARMIKEELVPRYPQITSLLLGTTTSLGGVAFCETETLLHGRSTVFEQLGKYRFEISANSFFQTNTRQAERLYDTIIEFAGFTGSENVYDLYCGAGTISIYISSLVRQVTGFESVDSAIRDANNNCKLNNVNNCRFVAGDLKDLLKTLPTVRENYGAPDVLIIDPPRGGMHPDTVRAVLELLPQRIVHVSCNPATLARDLAILCEQEYRLVKVIPVDMFPHTAHVEVVALLQRTGTG